MKRPRPFVLTAKRPSDAFPTSAVRGIAPTDIVIVNGDSVHVCRVDMANGLPRDGAASLSLCRHRAAGEATGPAAELYAGATRVGDVLMLWVE